MESESMAENKTNNMKRVRKSRWGPELPLLRNTETADESVHESSSQTNLRTLPNGTNDEHAEKEGGSSDTTLIQEHNDSCRSIEKQVSDIKQEISHEIQMEVSQPSTTPVEEKVELETSDKNQVNNTDQEVSNSEIIGNNTSLTQDLNSGAQHNEPSEKSQKEKSGIVNIETTCAISVKPLKDLIKPKDTTETQLVISSQNVLSVSSECTTGHATTSYLNSESEIIKSSENTILANKEIQQESSEDKSHDTRYFYGFDSVSDKYSKFLKMLETIRMNTKARKHMEVEQIKISIDEQKNRQLEMISERGVKKENVLDTCNETENDGVETVHGMEVESETQVESVDMLHETGSERLKGKLSEDKVMKNYYEGISRREIEKKSSKNFDVSNENLKTEGNFKINFTDAEINFTPDEPKDSDIESDKTDERNGVKGNIEDGSTLLKPNKKSRSSIKKPVYFDIANPAYLKPFDYGWKRELVFRSTNEGSNKRNSDVYYYTPKGKKVRSFREVIENLTDNELTVDNFTFFKEALGVEPEKEIIRDAKIKITKDSTSSPVEKKTQTKSKKSLSKKVSPSATPSHEDSPTSQTSNHMQTPTPPKISLTPKVVFRGAKPKLSSGPKFKVTPSRNGVPGQIQKTYSKEKKRKLSEELELEMGMLPPMWQPHDKLTPKMRDKENSTNKAVPVSSGASCGKSMEVCSIRCPLAMGLIPTLQCHVCLCLYHPECVGIKEALNRTIHSYKCKNCQNDSKAQKSSTNASKNNSNNLRLPLSLSPPPLTPISTLSSVSTNSVHPAPCSPPKLQRLQDGKVVTVPCSVTKAVPKTQSIVGGVTTWLPPSSTIQLSPTVKLSSSVKPSPPVTTTVVDSTSATLPTQSLVTMNNKRYVIVPKHNVLSVSPAATSSSVHVADPSIPQSTVATSDQGVTITPSLTSVVTQGYGPGSPVLPKPIPTSGTTFLVSSPATPSTTFQNPPGVLLVPYIPPQSPNQSSLRDGQQPPPPQYVIVNGAGLPAGNLIFGNIPQQQAPIKLPAIPTSQAAEPSSESASMKRPAVEQAEDSPPTKKFKKDVDIPNHMQYFMMHLSAGYLALLHAFQYLKVHELLRASRVCHMWRDIAMHKTLWETVKMKNSRVRDWEGFAQTLKKVGTRHLDLRKMLVPDTQEALHTMWMEFSKAIAKVNSLRRLDLCKCSSRLIEQVAAACPYLEGLSAHTIRSSHLNLSCLEKCKTLMDLRLKGASNSIEVSNIVSLKSLNKLRFLSLTSVQNLSEDIVVVLENLPHLESLELGECDRLPNKFVTESLPKLTKLKRLRLEKGTGPDCPTVSLLEAVSKCSQLTQLELVNFDIKQGFDTALGLCTNIKTLLIIPTYITQSATTNHLVMEGVSKLSKTLTHFVWGLTLELLRVTDLFIDQWEVQRSGTKPQSSGKRPGSGDSIPILKPDKSAAKKDGGTPLQVDVLQLPKLHKVLTTLLPVTKIRILKVPFIATWRQTVTGATQ